ncbi:hypothetical protein EYF80_067235 [Liparis tanakae]|uniref:Uncharacterized protein n=1 Tax=Liparis tanakae TaxID=230148 RepID=A0A4Z2E2C4_9TELE|nr:hypothetical protein EYF80_067235 [Liparis tanakae]
MEGLVVVHDPPSFHQQPVALRGKTDGSGHQDHLRPAGLVQQRPCRGPPGEVSAQWRSLPSGGLCPVEDSVQWRSLSSGGLCPVEDSVQWRTLSSGGLCPVEDSVLWRTLSSGGLCPVEDSVLWRTLSSGGLCPVEDSVQWRSSRGPADLDGLLDHFFSSDLEEMNTVHSFSPRWSGCEPGH